MTLGDGLERPSYVGRAILPVPFDPQLSRVTYTR